MDLVTQQKLERREHILERARELIAAHGYDGITVRELAAHCRVSVPTLYNQFGSKDALLATAVGSHFSGLLAGSRTRQWRGHGRLVGVIGICADEMLRLEEYQRALLRAFMRTRKTARLQETLMEELAAELEVALAEMRERDHLASWVDLGVLGQQIKGASMAAAVAWAIGELDGTTLRAAMVYGAAALVLGAARGAARPALERELRKSQEVLAKARAAPPARSAQGS